jgi:hypothetical protein
MNKPPESLWPVILAGMGVALGFGILLNHTATDSTRHDVANLALTLIGIAGGLSRGGSASTSNVNAPNSTISNETGGGFPPKGDK